MMKNIYFATENIAFINDNIICIANIKKLFLVYLLTEIDGMFFDEGKYLQLEEENL